MEETEITSDELLSLISGEYSGTVIIRAGIVYADMEELDAYYENEE